MSKTYYIVAAALLLALAVSPASAEPNPGIVAGVNASNSIAQTPGAAAVVIEASEAIIAEVSAFAGMSASLHTEDQCSVTNLSVSRSKPSVGAVTTFLSYNVANVCDDTQNAFGSLEVPDAVFTGDPRTGNKVTLNIDLSASPSLVTGPPLVANITWIKTPPAPLSAINRSNNRSVSDTRDSAGVRAILTFNSVFTSVTARLVDNGVVAPAVSSLSPFNDDTTGSIFWDNTTNISELQ